MCGDKLSAPRHVLVVDNDQSTCDTIAAMVETTGATPVIAYDGVQALTLARTRFPALVITDWMMPQMTGDVLIAALRKECGPDLPVILVSGEPLPQLLRAGADAVLRKPFLMADLLALLDRFLVGQLKDGQAVASTPLMSVQRTAAVDRQVGR